MKVDSGSAVRFRSAGPSGEGGSELMTAMIESTETTAARGHDRFAFTLSLMIESLGQTSAQRGRDLTTR